MIRITFEIQPDNLGGFTDCHLAALWHIAQANPAPFGDPEAGKLVRAIGAEIVRRWLRDTPPELFAHQAGDYLQAQKNRGSLTGSPGAAATEGGRA